jgi:stage II sporulation protein D
LSSLHPRRGGRQRRSTGHLFSPLAPRSVTGASLAAAAAVATALAASCQTGLPLQRLAPVPKPPALESLVPSPAIRVGLLPDVRKASVSADSGVVVLDYGKDRPWTGRKTTVQRATFVSSAGEQSRPRFCVQVASLVDGGAARDLAARAQAASGMPPTLRYSPENATYQVRIGEFPTRDDAAALSRSLRAAGLGSPFPLEEPGPQPGAHVRLLETGEEFASVTVLPASPGEELAVDGAPFRGVFEVRGGEGDTITVVNVVNLEDYLKGVVPNELSPQGFPQIEALKAQAVAARTYALRNHDQFEAKGYDLCATPSCQVYKGRASEDPLSNHAVDETRGTAAYYHGALINAYYTSTCGGHTEDGANIFEGYPQPYLRGVACVPEHSAWSTIRSTAVRAPVDPESRDLALLTALGIVEPDTALSGVATEKELKSWTTGLLRALHRTGCEAPPAAQGATRGQFFRMLVSSLCWEERAVRLLAPGDPDYLLQVEDRAELDAPERLAAALLLSEGILAPFPDNTLRVHAGVMRAQAIRVLARTALRAGGPSLMTGEFQGTDGGALVVKQGAETASEPLGADVRLFRDLAGSASAASEVSLPVGEKVSFVLQDGRVTFLEAQENPLGAASDRTSHYYRWEVRLTPAQVASGIARYGNVGRVRDLSIRKIGTSGRVVELSVLGSEGELLLRGLRIRNALGLRESLFVLDRERDGSGAVELFILTGKGWGHGVGLCQVGSYGMALAGSTYEEILRHYYTGISLGQAY